MVLALALFVKFVDEKGVKEQQGQHQGAYCWKPLAVGVATLVQAYKVFSEPFSGQKVVNAKTKHDGSDDNGQEIDEQITFAKYSLYDQNTGHVAGWTG